MRALLGYPAVLWTLSTTAYAVIACALKWPLPLHFKTHLLADPAGGAGVYVWNLWIFRHELLQHAHLPFSTDHIFALTGGADFSLHNYAPVAAALAVPLIGLLGVVGAFNVVAIALTTLTALSTFVLARRLGLDPLVAWAVGVVLIASPTLTSRDGVHFSLTIAAALPGFLWALIRTLDHQRSRDAALVGAMVAMASYSDAHFGIFCVLMGMFLVAWRFAKLTWVLPANVALSLARD